MLGLISTRYFASKVTPSTARRAAAAAAPQTPLGLKINPYTMFVKENFKKDSNSKNTDVMKELSRQWKNLSVDAKKQYTNLTNEYNEKKVNDFLKLSTEEQKELVNLSIEKKAARAERRHAKERREKRKQEGRPVVPPNAYALFIKEKVTGGGNEVTQKLKEASVLWKKMGEDQKKKYVEEAKKLSDEFHMKLEKWESEKQGKKAEEAH